MAARPQQHSNLVFGLLQNRRVKGFRGILDILTRSIYLEVGLDGNGNKTVLRMTEYAAFRDGHANDGEGSALDLDGLADRIAVAEQVVLNVLSDDSYGGVVIVFDLGEIAAGGQLSVGQYGPV